MVPAEGAAAARPPPRVSVVMTVYDRRDCVCEAIDSALSQTYRDREVVVVDDASSDGSADLVAERFPKVRLVRLPRNVGCAGARNAALEVARGEYLAFLDSDDVWAPEKLARQVERLDARPEDVAVFTRVSWRDAARPPPPTEPPSPRLPDILVQLLTFRFLAFPSTCLARRDAVDRVGRFHEPLRRLQDIDLWLRLATVGRLSEIPEPLVERRVRPDQLTGSYAAGDAYFRLVYARMLARPEGRAARRVLRRVLQDRRICIFERWFFEGRWREAMAELREALLREPMVLFRSRFLRSRLVPILRFGLGNLLGHDLGKRALARVGLGRYAPSGTTRTGSS